MRKSTNNFRDLYNELSDCVEHVATYGMNQLSDSELIYARKLSEMCQEYIDTYDVESEAVVEDDDNEEE